MDKEKMNSLSLFQNLFHNFYSTVDKKFPIAIEIRNPYYLNNNYFRFIAEQNIYHVFLEGYFMPSIVEVYNKYENYLKGQTIIRLHGPDRSGIEKISDGNWNKIYIDRENDLRNIAGMIKDLLNRDITVYLNVNNHYEGCAPMTIERIQKLL
jgi:uncharacterized protein YecE (DUF72 family)